MNNIAEHIKTNPDAFDYQDCRPAKEPDEFWAKFNKQSNDGLPDYLKDAIKKSKSVKQDA